MTDPTTAAERLRTFFRPYPSRTADLDEALAEAAAPYRDLLDRLVKAWEDEGDDAFYVAASDLAYEARALLRREVGEP